MHPLTKACIAIIAILVPAAVLADAPLGIGGFKLGETIDDCREELQLETVLPIRYKPYLKEVQMRAQPGFKSGLLLYEECAHPGRIVRIKMKYADSSKAFYRELLQRFRERFGNNAEWRGDPFHVVLAWKWKFKDVEGNEISVILQHNIKDTDEKMGNSLKMTLYNAMEEAEACYDAKKPPESAERRKQKKTAPDWAILIPR
jgi:hypothetical protein